jgi:glutathione S-transferase
MAKPSLFSARACPFAHRTRLVLAQKGVDFELVEIDLQNKPAWFQSVSGYGIVDFTLFPWFERWPALDHFRAFSIPKEHARLATWVSALAALPSVRSQSNAPEYYIERYARFAAPPAHQARA